MGPCGGSMVSCPIDTFKALDRGMVADVCLRQTLIDIALGRNTKRSYALSALVSDHLGLDISGL